MKRPTRTGDEAEVRSIGVKFWLWARVGTGSRPTETWRREQESSRPYRDEGTSNWFAPPATLASAPEKRKEKRNETFIHSPINPLPHSLTLFLCLPPSLTHSLTDSLIHSSRRQAISLKCCLANGNIKQNFFFSLIQFQAEK